MTDTTTPGLLADDLEAILRKVAGITAIYPSAPLPAVIAGDVLAATPLPLTAPHLITVSSRAAGTAVTAHIGVAATAPAHETGRAAHARITDYLNRSHTRTDTVTVRIGTVGT